MHQSQQLPLQSWEVDQHQACRRGYHLLRIPCQNFHRALLAQQQQQQHQHQHQAQQQQQHQQHQQTAGTPLLDNLTSCSIRTPASAIPPQPRGILGNSTSRQQQQQQLQHNVKVSPPASVQQRTSEQQQPTPQAPRRKRSSVTDRQAIYQRMRAILSEAGEDEETTAAAAAAAAANAPSAADSASSEPTESQAETEEEEDEEEEEEEEEGEEENEDEEEEEEEEEETECETDDVTPVKRESPPPTAPRRRPRDDSGAASPYDAFAGSNNGGPQRHGRAVADSGEGFQIVSKTEGDDNMSFNDDDIRAALTEPQCAASRAQTLLASAGSVADRGTGGGAGCSRSILKNGRSRYTGNTYSSEQYTRGTSQAGETSTDVVTHSTYDSVMSRMRARQSELTRCVLQEQQREQQLRQQQELESNAAMEVLSQHRQAALQACKSLSFGQQSQQQQPTECQQQQQQLLHDRGNEAGGDEESSNASEIRPMEGWDCNLPAALRGVKSDAVPPPPVSTDPTPGARRRVQLTGLSGLCRERRPFVAKGRDFQSRSGPMMMAPSYSSAMEHSAAYSNGGRLPSVTQRLYTTEAPYNVNTAEAQLFRRIFCRALDPSVLPAARAV